MLYFEISNDYTHVDVATYLYTKIDKIEKLENFYVRNFKNKRNKDDNTESDEETKQYNYMSDINITLGFGKYIYNMDENTKIEINYMEKGNPVGTYHSAKVYNQMIIGCETLEIWKKFEQEMTDFIDGFHRKDRNKLNIFIVDKYGSWIKYSKIPSRKLSTIYTDEDIKRELKNDITKFIKDESEYDMFGIPYKRTYMLTGVPGSGKTSLIKALCNEFDKNLCILSINKEFDNSTIVTAFRNMDQDSFLLIEDIDCLFEKREHKDNPLITFSSFINLLDGVLYKHSLICFITTNHPERLDHAILRSGRIDMIIKMDYPLKEDIKRLFFDLTSKNNTPEEIIIESNKFIENIADKNITMSAIVNFIFKYRMDSNKYIKELISSNDTIMKYTGDKSNTMMYL